MARTQITNRTALGGADRTYVSPTPKFSMFFDGTNDDVDFNDVFDIGTNDFTLACRVKMPKAPASTGDIVAKSDGSSDGRWLLWANSTGTLNFTIDFGDVYSVNSTNLFVDDYWHDVVVTVDRDGNMEITVDGSSEDTTDISSQSAVDVSTAIDFRFASGNGSNFWRGWLADVVIDIGTVWDSDDITNYSKGVVKSGYDEYFDFSSPDHVTTTVTGLEGTSGTRSGAIFTVIHPFRPKQLIRSSVTLNSAGTTQNVTVPDASLPSSLTPPFTMEAFFQFHGKPSGAWAIIQKGNINNQPSFALWGLNSVGLATRFRTSGGSTINLITLPAYVYEQDRIIHTTAEINSTDASLYLDGILLDNDSTVDDGDFNDNALNLYFGGFSYAALNNKMTIYEVRFWQTSRSQAEIIANGSIGAVSENDSNLLALWKFDDASGTTITEYVNGYDGTLNNEIGDDSEWGGVRSIIS